MNMTPPDYFADLEQADNVGWAGDWHGNTQWAQHAIRTLALRDVHVIYQVGDFGLWGGPDGAAYLRKVHRELAKHDAMVIVTPGNHENYDMLDKFPVNEPGFLYRPDVDRIWFAPRGHVWTHNGAYLASLGGAGSIDIRMRTPHKSWWAQEEITQKDVDALAASIADWGITSVDVMMTHESPAGIYLGPKGNLSSPEVEHYCYAQRILVRDAVDIATPKTLVHGHWHRHFIETLEGVNVRGDEYQTEVVALDMDYTQNNLMTGCLAPASGIVNKEVIWK